MLFVCVGFGLVSLFIPVFAFWGTQHNNNTKKTNAKKNTKAERNKNKTRPSTQKQEQETHVCFFGVIVFVFVIAFACSFVLCCVFFRVMFFFVCGYSLGLVYLFAFC